MLNKLCKHKLIVIIMLSFMIVLLASTSFAYWAATIQGNSEDASALVGIGEWTTDHDENDYPENTLDLNEVINTNPNTTIAQGTYFIYNGYLYIVTANNYNPNWHGNPGQLGSNWAWILLELPWESWARYEANTIVTYNGNFYKANYYTVNNIPSSSPGQWTQIQPMTDAMFNVIPGTNRPDYTNPIPSYVIPL